MSKASDLLDRIKIPEPCSANWDEMVGNDQVRFCTHCSKHVTNISEMTRKRARELVARSHGRLCIRYYHRPDGTVQTLSERNGPLYRIKRRASKIAAGAFSAALGLSATAAAQTPAQTDQSNTTSCQQAIQVNNSPRSIFDSGSASITGTVSDPNGAVIPGATVTLISAGGLVRNGTTDEAGQYSFQNLEAGDYVLRVFAQGFNSFTVMNQVRDGGSYRADASLELGEISVQGGAMAVAASDPLVLAASNDDLNAVKKLLAEGAEVNKRDDNTETTALDEAVMHGNREMVRVLLNAGAEVNARTRNKQTALMRLDNDATASLVWDLVNAGARVNARDSDGDTPLIMASRYSTPEVVKALISAGARVNMANHEGETALMAAADADEVDIVEVLFNAGADINARDHDGNTALKRARDGDYSEVVEFLRVHNALEDVEEVKTDP